MERAVLLRRVPRLVANPKAGLPRRCRLLNGMSASPRLKNVDSGQGLKLSWLSERGQGSKREAR